MKLYSLSLILCLMVHNLNALDSSIFITPERNPTRSPIAVQQQQSFPQQQQQQSFPQQQQQQSFPPQQQQQQHEPINKLLTEQTFAPIPETAAPSANVPISTHTATAAAYGDINLRISDTIASNVLRFAQNVGKQLLQQQQRQKDIQSSKVEVFSPLSIMSALAFVMLGAKGRSYQQLSQLFGIDYDSELITYPYKLHEQLGLMLTDLQQQDVRNISPMRGEDPWRSTQAAFNLRGNNKGKRTSSEHIVRVANGLFTQKGYNINPDYKEVIGSIYHSELAQLDFQRQPSPSRSYINEYVNRNTYGKIPNIIDGDIERGTNVIIASALYFKAFWETDFFAAATKPDDFYPNGLGTQPVKVNMMSTGGVHPYYDAPEYGCRIIGLPYKGNLTTMYVIQPHDSSQTKLRQLQNDLDAGKIEDMISHMVRRSTILLFPKMHVARTVNMKNLLQNMGVRDIFTNGVSDLSLIGNGFQAAVNPHAVPMRTNMEAAAAASSGGAAFLAPNIAKAESSQSSSPLDRYGEPAHFFVRGDFIDHTTESLHNLENARHIQEAATSDLYVDDIVHKVDFNVNEQGTEAAAATVTYLRKSGPEIVFRADTPFLFLVRHDPTKLIMFYGIVNQPPAVSYSNPYEFVSE